MAGFSLTKLMTSSENQLVQQLERFNDNFERYLRFLKVPMGSADEKPQSPFVGLPLSEFEQAIKEHAALMEGENAE